MRLLIAETTWGTMAAAHDLREAGYRLSSVDDGGTLVDFARVCEHDAAVLSTDLPYAKASEIVAELRSFRPTMPIIVLVEGKCWKAERAALYTAGADAVLDTPIRGPELSARLRAMILRVRGVTTSRIVSGGLELDPSVRRICVGRRRLRMPGEGSADARRIPFTHREYDILELLILAQGRLVSRDEIMDRVYAFEDEPDPRVLDVYTTRIRQKLAAAGLPRELLQSVSGRGLRFAADAASSLAA